MASLSGCDGPTSKARALLIDSIAVDLRSGSTTASCCASLVRDKGLSRSQAQRIVRKAAVSSGVNCAASKRSHAVADTVEHLLAGGSRKECRDLLTHDRGFTPKQVKAIVCRAVVCANQQELYDKYIREQERDEAKEYDDKNKEFEQARAACS